MAWPALDVHRNAADHAPVLALEPLGDAQQRHEHARVLAASAVERRVRFVVHLRLGPAIVITHQHGHHVAPPAAQAGNIAIAHEIFAVAVMRLVADRMADVVKNCAPFRESAVHLRPISCSGRN